MYRECLVGHVMRGAPPNNDKHPVMSMRLTCQLLVANIRQPPLGWQAGSRSPRISFQPRRCAVRSLEQLVTRTSTLSPTHLFISSQRCALRLHRLTGLPRYLRHGHAPSTSLSNEVGSLIARLSCDRRFMRQKLGGCKRTAESHSYGPGIRHFGGFGSHPVALRHRHDIQDPPRLLHNCSVRPRNLPFALVIRSDGC